MSIAAQTNDLPRRGKRQLPEAMEAGSVSSPGVPVTKGTGQKGLESLTKFIPTEILAPYIAAFEIGAAPVRDSCSEPCPIWDAAAIYVTFIVAAPLLLILFEFGKSAASRLPWPSLPVLGWRALAAAIAFAVWGLAVPQNPYQSLVGGAAAAAFFAMVISPVLTALDAIALRVLMPRGA